MAKIYGINNPPTVPQEGAIWFISTGESYVYKGRWILLDPLTCEKEMRRIKSTKKLPQRLSHDAITYISRRINDMHTDIMTYFSPRMLAEEFYRLVIPENEYDALYRASQLMPKQDYYSSIRALCLNVNIPGYLVDVVLFSIIPFNHNSMPQWLWPTNMNVITPGSKLAEIFLPPIDLAIRLATQSKLFELIARDYTPQMIMALMPWLKLLLLHRPNDFSSWSPYIHREIGRMLEAKRPRYMPAMSVWYSSQLDDGKALLTEYMFIRDKKQVSETKHVSIVIKSIDSFVPVWLVDQHNSIVSEYNRMMNQDRAQN